MISYLNKKSLGQNTRSVQYFNHFPKFLLKLYGSIESSIPKAYMIEKANPINCKWFTRPKIAASEFAETVTSSSG